jgi:DMSO/TMAO reductase YedYZ heme-binding membrane subunit
MKRSTLKRIAIAAAIIAFILIQAYLETSAGFTPNH